MRLLTLFVSLVALLAVETEGVFRIAGSQKRMRELQETFDLPPRYGKDVDWSKYSIHDAASVLRRYLNQMPEPIIPLHLYNEFRNIMIKEPFDVQSAIKTYRLLITSSPPANQYLLLYVLDLLAVFARASDKNLMPASNLAVIFQPGMFSHPTHLSSAGEHKIAVQVLEFLIEHQDHFVLGLSHPPPANVSPADLTAVSQPSREDEVYFEPSDSDEDLGQLEAHQGGGAALMAKRSVPGGHAGPGKRRLFGKRNAVTGGVEMQPSASMQVMSRGNKASSNERLNNQVIGGGSPPGAGSDRGSPSVKYADESGDHSGGPSRTPSSGSKMKRSKTTPTRRSASGTAGPTAASGSGSGNSTSRDTTEDKQRRRRSGMGGTEESKRTNRSESPVVEDVTSVPADAPGADADADTATSTSKAEQTTDAAPS